MVAKKINGITPSIREMNNHSKENVNTYFSNVIFSGKKSLFGVDSNNIKFNCNFNNNNN